ncbi:MAG: UPF0104 family protein [Acidobacteria bacterium]|nr:UPF0104 family protein [Acidobacteriota bacterium]
MVRRRAAVRGGARRSRLSGASGRAAGGGRRRARSRLRDGLQRIDRPGSRTLDPRRHTDRACRIVRHVPLVRPGRAEAFVRTLAGHIRRLGADHRRSGAAIAFAAANWLLDAAALGVVFVAFGHPVPFAALLTEYGLGSILATLPLTPGGLHIVEGVMVPAFIAFGVPATAALLGVIGWRLIEYWLPLPVAVLSYGSLRLGPLRTRRRCAAGEPAGR